MLKTENKTQPLTQNKLKELLSQQTGIILGAVDQKLEKMDKKLVISEKRLETIDKRLAILEKRFDKMEIRLDKMEININHKFDRLITTLDKFLKRITDLDDEFEIMKNDINRMKRVIKEKLGVELL